VLPNGRFCSGVSSGKVSRHQLRRDTAYSCKNSLLVRYLFREGFLCASRHQNNQPSGTLQGRVRRPLLLRKSTIRKIATRPRLSNFPRVRDFAVASLATYARMCVCSHPAVEQSSNVAFRNRGDESFLVENLSRQE
jgi:hypothetical protein